MSNNIFKYIEWNQLDKHLKMRLKKQLNLYILHKIKFPVGTIGNRKIQYKLPVNNLKIPKRISFT